MKVRGTIRKLSYTTRYMAQLVKNPPAHVGGLHSISGLGISSEEGKGYLLQYSDLENSIDCIVHGVAKRQTRLSNFHIPRNKYILSQLQ